MRSIYSCSLGTFESIGKKSWSFLFGMHSRASTDEGHAPVGTQQVQALVSFVSLLVFVLFFGLGAGPIPWVYLPEVLPNEIKGPGASLGTGINWISTFLVGLSFPIMLRVLSVGGSYLVYAVFNFVALAFSYGYMVETKRRSLADIQTLLLLEQR